MDEDEKPVMTEQQLWEYLHDEMGLPVTRRAIKWAVLRREIVPTRLGYGNYFSKSDGLDWVKLRKQYGNYSAPDDGQRVGHAREVAERKILPQ
jgi:hypothetical protein